MSGAAQNSNPGSGSNLSQNDLRRTFIGMLFALVAATIAQQIGELLFVVTGGWDVAANPVKMWRNLIFGEGMLLASLSHALLTLLLVSMSWIMWSKSQAAGHRTEISTVFSKEFVILLTEFFLVVLYFAIAKTMEQNFSDYLKTKSISTYVGEISGRPEAIQLMWVFFVFFVWDLLVDVIYSPRDMTPGMTSNKFFSSSQGILTYCSVSLLCILAAWFVTTMTSSLGTPYEAVLADIALIAILLFFNIGKQLEFYLIKLFPGEKSRKNTKRDVKPSDKTLIIMFLFISIYICSMVILNALKTA